MLVDDIMMTTEQDPGGFKLNYPPSRPLKIQYRYRLTD